MGNAFSLVEMFKLGWPILSVLLAASVVSFSIIWERWNYFKKTRVDVREYFAKLGTAISSPKNSSLDDLGEPMAHITRFALEHLQESSASLELAVDRSIRLTVSEMEKHVAILGTIAGSAPFVGLLGTVLGIIRAFRTLAFAGAGGPQVVASGIAEALIATAVGLIVAIPSLVAYNLFSTRIRRQTENMEICADGLIELLMRLKEEGGRKK